MRTAAIICAYIMLTACATTEIKVPVPVDVAVPVSCLPSTVPKRPLTFSDPDLAAMDDAQFVFALRWNAERLGEYVAELEALLRACR